MKTFIVNRIYTVGIIHHLSVTESKTVYTMVKGDSIIDALSKASHYCFENKFKSARIISIREHT